MDQKCEMSYSCSIEFWNEIIETLSKAPGTRHIEHTLVLLNFWNYMKLFLVEVSQKLSYSCSIKFLKLQKPFVPCRSLPGLVEIMWKGGGSTRKAEIVNVFFTPDVKEMRIISILIWIARIFVEIQTVKN